MMTHRPHARSTSPRIWAALAILFAGYLAGCGLLSPHRTPLYDGPQGAVLLENVPERGATAGFRSTVGLDAAHPVILEPNVVAAALQGIQIKTSSSLGSLLDTSGPPTPVFSEEDIAFLAPLISTALTKATPAQFVRFRLHRPSTEVGPVERIGAAAGSAPPATGRAEQTSGALYVYGRSLHFTLTEYRYSPERPETVHMANRKITDPTGLTGRVVSFIPAAALRSDSYRRAVLPLSDDLPSLVIDYQALHAVGQTRPAQPTMPSAPTPATVPSRQLDSGPPPGSAAPAAAPSTSSEVRDLKELVIKKDLELERLREEVQQLKQDKARTTTPATGKPAGKKPPQPKSGTP